MSVVEKVARAICGGDPDRLVEAGNPQGDPADYPVWMLAMPEARRAITAMLDDMAEPTEAVLATVVANAEVRPMAIRFWQAMLAQYRKDAKL